MKCVKYSVGMLAICAGMAAAAPAVKKQAQLGHRIDPAFVTPEYFVDGVWVEGPTVPYSPFSSRNLPCDRKVVFDGGYISAEGYDPCSGAGYLFTSTTDTSSPALYDVRAAMMINDYSDMDPVAVNKEITGWSWAWHQFGTEPTLRIRFRWYDRCNITNSTTFGTGPVSIVAAGIRMGVTFTYNGAVEAGDWYTTFDQDPSIFAPGSGFLDRDGAVQVIAETTPGVQSSVIQFRMQGVNGTAGHPGSSVPLLWIDDSGELGRVSSTHAYDITSAVANNAIQITGTPENGNESYFITDSNCFTSGLGPAMSWWVRDCCPPAPAMLVAPANAARGVTNPVTCVFLPPSELPVDFDVNIKLNGHIQTAFSKFHQLSSSVILTNNLASGRAYGWSVTSNAAGTCPGTESQTWVFRMGGCPADFNLDFSIDFFDYLDFMDALAQGADIGDYNADQTIDFFDYLDFVAAFSAGC
jgi:hypothetical protein